MLCNCDAFGQTIMVMQYDQFTAAIKIYVKAPQSVVMAPAGLPFLPKYARCLGGIIAPTARHKSMFDKREGMAKPPFGGNYGRRRKADITLFWKKRNRAAPLGRKHFNICCRPRRVCPSSSNYQP